MSIAASLSTACDLAMMLRRYGLMLPADVTAESMRNDWGVAQGEQAGEQVGLTDTTQVVIAATSATFEALGIHAQLESPRQLLYPTRRWWNLRKPQPSYHALLEHVSFDPRQVEPVWVNAAGRVVVGWLHTRGRKVLLVGLDVSEEIIRHTQGDPAQLDHPDKAKFGFAFERPNYLFDAQLHPQHRTQPWADLLGFALVEWLSPLIAAPLVEPLPDGARGLVMLTGDDDQAELTKYAEQLKRVGSFPITYYLLPHTRHTRDTLAQMSGHVEFGLHVDALESPELYDEICVEQTFAVRRLTGAAVRTIRNHGFLNRGYLGHLSAWQRNDLFLDVNYPGVDGTVLNGSLLPYPVRRSDGEWTSHYSLLTAFGDGMIYALKLPPTAACARIEQLANQVEASRPGVLVFNLHPQNISDTATLHDAAMAVGRRPGWMACGAESYLNWIHRLDGLTLQRDGERCAICDSAEETDWRDRVMLRTHVDGRWQRTRLADWSGGLQRC